MTGPTDTPEERPEDAANDAASEAAETVEAEVVDEPQAAFAGDASPDDETVDAEPLAAEASGTRAGWYTLGVLGLAAAGAVALSLTGGPTTKAPESIRMANATEADLAAGRDTEVAAEAAPVAETSASVIEEVSAPADHHASASMSGSSQTETLLSEADANNETDAASNAATEDDTKNLALETSANDEAPAEIAEAANVETGSDQTETGADDEATAEPLVPDEADDESAVDAEEEKAALAETPAAQDAPETPAEVEAAPEQEPEPSQAEEPEPTAEAAQTDPLVQARIDRLESQLAAAQARADEALALAQEDPEADAEVEALQARVAELSERLDEVRGGVASRIENDLTSLKAELLQETQAATEAANAAVEEARQSRQSLAADREAITRQIEEIERLRAEVRSSMAARDQSAEQSAADIEQLRSELLSTFQQREVASAQQIDALRQRLERLQSEEVATASKTAATSLALLNLQRQVTQGKPFATELAAVRALSPNLAPLGQLQSYANDGLPSQAFLSRTFRETAREAQRAAVQGNAESGLSKLAANFMSLVTVRKAGDVPGETPAAILSRAETRLEANDLEGAVEELDALKGPAAEKMDEWLSAARARVAVDELMNQVSAQLIRDIEAH